MTTPTTLPAFDGTTPIREHPRRAFVEQIMGLPVSVHVRGPHARTPGIAEAVTHFFEQLKSVDTEFSPWKHGSAVSRIQRKELLIRDAGMRVREVADLCQEAERRTNGTFSAWINGVFDPTGLVKGWAVERAAEQLRTHLGPHDLLVNAGGDVLVACARVDTPDWRIAVEDPRDRSRTLLTVPLRRGAVATSGTAARGDHIIDPTTKAPPTGLLSATVIGPSLLWADVHATAAFVRNPESAEPDHVAILVPPDGRPRIITAFGAPRSSSPDGRPAS